MNCKSSNIGTVRSFFEWGVLGGLKGGIITCSIGEKGTSGIVGALLKFHNDISRPVRKDARA